MNSFIETCINDYNIQRLLAELEERNSETSRSTLSFWYYHDESVINFDWDECYIAYFNEYRDALYDEGHYLRIYYDGGETFDAEGLGIYYDRWHRTYPLSELENLLKVRYKAARNELIQAVKDGEWIPEKETYEYMKEMALC